MIRGSVDGGFRNPPVRWLMLAVPFTAGDGHLRLLRLAAVPARSSTATRPRTASPGLAAAIFAGAQIVGRADRLAVLRLFRRRTDALLLGGVLDVVLLVLLGLTGSFVVALVLLAAWCIRVRVEAPMRPAFINGVIPSEQRATVLSFDSLMGSAGGVVAQPALGRVADVSGYAASYLVAAGIQAWPCRSSFLARRENAVVRPDHERHWPIPTRGPGSPDRPRQRRHSRKPPPDRPPGKWVSAP